MFQKAISLSFFSSAATVHGEFIIKLSFFPVLFYNIIRGPGYPLSEFDFSGRLRRPADDDSPGPGERFFFLFIFFPLATTQGRRFFTRRLHNNTFSWLIEATSPGRCRRRAVLIYADFITGEFLLSFPLASKIKKKKTIFIINNTHAGRE